ncbi:HK97 family phage prohead protease [Streptomyces sp. T-3]|nr:HK97 family phage prohead protease [Streptomyces sp. T-3]
MRPELIRVTCAADTLSEAPSPEAGGSGQRTITGRIATYGADVSPMGPWSVVRLAEGALNVPDAPGRVKLLMGHDDARVIGSLAEDGFAVDGQEVTASFRLARTAAADEALTLAQDGHLDGLSVGYLVRDGRDLVEDGNDVFEVTAADLYEVSLVAFPADHQARVSAVTAKDNHAMTAVSEPQDRGVIDVAPADGPSALVTAEQISEAVRAAMAQLAPERTAPAAAPDLGGVRAEQAVTPDGWGRFVPGYTARNGTHVTAGDYISALLRHRDGDSDAWGRVQAALADDTTAKVPGLLPVPVVQPIIDTLAPIRPVFESLSSRVMPANGSKFQRPHIKTHVAVGEQTTELTEVPSQAMEVVLSDVSKRTIAGALRLSVQSIDWTTPALLDLVVSDFAKVYARWTEEDMSAKFAAGATGSPLLVGAAADPVKFNGAMYQATAQSWNEGGVLPNRVWMSTDVWSLIGSMVDANSRPLYPYFGSASNALGTLSPGRMLAGGNGNEVGSYAPVVGPFLPKGTLIVGPSQYAEVYEDRRGMLRVADPSALGQVLGWYGYIANYNAVPKSFVPVKFEDPKK